MSENNYHKAAEAMEDFGGTFTKSLALTWFAADPTNRKILQKAFNHVFNHYWLTFVKGNNE